MKLLKLSLCVFALVAISPAAHAVGVMEKEDIRDGQLICPKILALKKAQEAKLAAEEAHDTETANSAK